MLGCGHNYPNTHWTIICCDVDIITLIHSGLAHVRMWTYLFSIKNFFFNPKFRKIGIIGGNEISNFHLGIL